MYNIKILNKIQEAELLYSLQLLAPEELYKKYKIPGQYGVFSPEKNDSIYLAFSNAPLKKEPILEILVKDEGKNAQEILSLKPNDVLNLSDIQGKGFNLDRLKNQSIEAFAMGSGIAPIRALIQSILEGLISVKTFKLWMCAFTKNHVPYKNEFIFWKSIFPVELVLDQEHPHKNVIDVLKESKDDYSEKRVLWIGSKQFGIDLWNVLQQKGLSKENFLTNYENP
jgi:NAD(P)H-flavin reductase